jgi:ABC-2 type transport system ATP-binding protein
MMMADSPAIQAEDLRKRYGRRGTEALKGLTLQVNEGEVFGFLGPNGAGKSTTIRILLDLLRPTAGTVRVLGQDPRGNPSLRGHIGYLAGDFVVNGKQTGRELLTYLGDLRGGVPKDRIEHLAGMLDLDLSKKIGSLSKGNKQKVGVVQAFMHEPKLLILDEPTSGLDPFLQQQFVSLVQQASANGQTVFMSSHMMSEVQQTCDRVGIIRAGSLIAVEHIDDLRARAFRKVEVRFSAPPDPAGLLGISGLGVPGVQVEGNVLRCQLSGDADEFIKAIAKYHVVDILSEEPELEELFFSYYRSEQ